MNTRSLAAGVAAVTMVGAALAAATPAQAASYSVTVTCDTGSIISQTVTPGLVAGDTLAITYTSASQQCNYISIMPGSGGPLATPTAGATFISGTIWSIDRGTVVLTMDETPITGALVVNIGYGSSGPSWTNTATYLFQGTPPEPAATASAPADILQQTPIPASGSCADVVDEAFRYGTSVSGGWSKSWAAWIGSEIGGEVCTRTLTYSTSRGAWIVAS